MKMKMKIPVMMMQIVSVINCDSIILLPLVMMIHDSWW